VPGGCPRAKQMIIGFLSFLCWPALSIGWWHLGDLARLQRASLPIPPRSGPAHRILENSARL
jgi:hypothetical protein